MILHPLGEEVVAIRQSAHALLAFQLADHWGNRTTPRPSPRADVLAAVMLHDAGWDAHEEPPRLDSAGRPVAYDTIGSEERATIWAESVEHAGVRGRYVAYLVSHHFSSLAREYSPQSLAAFISRESARQARLREELATEASYRQLLGTSIDDVNRAIVRLCDAVAVLLSRGGGDAVLRDLPQRTGPAPLEIVRAAERSYRLRPWPFTGRRLNVVAEGRRLPRASFASDAELRAAWQAAPAVRLVWRLMAPGVAAS